MATLHRFRGLALGLPWLVLALALPFLLPGYYVQFGAKAMLLGMAALGLNLIVGYGGGVSLCHAAFFGLGGYALALLSPQSAGASLWLSLGVTLLGVGLVATLIGALSLRTRGVYFIMVTLAFGEMLFYLFHDTGIAGGSDGMYIYFKPEARLAGHLLFDLDDNRTYYFVALGLLVATLALLHQLVRAPYGHALVATRDNERRALSLGFPVFRIRLLAFVVSALIAAVAGYFSAAQFGFVAPQMLGWHFSALLLVMVVLGGKQALAGPLVGTLALLGLEELLKAHFEHWKLIEGVLVVALVFLLPGGVYQIIDAAGARLRNLGRGEGAGAASEPLTGYVVPRTKAAE